MPFLGGLILDSKGHRIGVLTFLVLTMIGHIAFTVAMQMRTYWLAVVGELIYGLGSGTVVVAQRAIVAKFFFDKELTFALGVTVAASCVAKTVAKASVAPISDAYGGYVAALWYVAFWQGLSLLAGLVYSALVQKAEVRVGLKRSSECGHPDFSLQALLLTVKKSTTGFWLLTALHTLFICAYHLFANYSGHYLTSTYEMSTVTAGYVSSLIPLTVVFIAPFAGLFLDRVGGQVYVLLVAAALTLSSYIALLHPSFAHPVLCILTLAICESFVPIVLLSALPLVVDETVYGVAFGITEVVGSVGLLIGNFFMGYSRDITSSYHNDICAVAALSLLGFVLVVWLLYWDRWYVIAS
ncbi:unnamed protein product [Chrysoparadoxa australica]